MHMQLQNLCKELFWGASAKSSASECHMGTFVVVTKRMNFHKSQGSLCRYVNSTRGKLPQKETIMW